MQDSKFPTEPKKMKFDTASSESDSGHKKFVSRFLLTVYLILIVL